MALIWIQNAAKSCKQFPINIPSINQMVQLSMLPIGLEN